MVASVHSNISRVSVFWGLCIQTGINYTPELVINVFINSIMHIHNVLKVISYAPVYDGLCAYDNVHTGRMLLQYQQHYNRVKLHTVVQY